MSNASVSVWQVKEASQQPQMVFTVRHATVTFQTDGDTWREQKEKKAALMVGILIGVFVLCWIPFFITELINPLCSCDIPPLWKSIFLWLGYSNSFFNPLIYTAFNKNYNNAFRNLFTRQQWGICTQKAKTLLEPSPITRAGRHGVSWERLFQAICALHIERPVLVTCVWRHFF